MRLVKADVPAGGVDIEPLTLVSSESVAELACRAGVAPLDGRRFRMLLEIEGCRPARGGHLGGPARRGSARPWSSIGGPVARCATTTRDPSTGQRDFDTLREIAAYRGKRDGKKIDFGVYAHVVRPGASASAIEVEPG